ncbi:hypothetical protein HY642_06155 [Candidatus Woesearchaeota archaeon]|nr:hypothetical protein [Candidatus Woesearchaeota archaeon]
MVVREDVINRVIQTINEQLQKPAHKRMMPTPQLVRLLGGLRGIKRQHYDHVIKLKQENIAYKPSTTFTDGSVHDKAYVEELWKFSRALYKKEYAVPICGKATVLESDPHHKFPLLLAGKGSKLCTVHEDTNQRGGVLYKMIKQDRWYCGYCYKGIGTLGRPITFKRFDATYPSGKVDGGFYKYWAIEEYRLNKRACEYGLFGQHPAGVYDIHTTIAGRQLAVLVRMVSSPIRMSSFLHDGGFATYLTIRYGSPSISAFKKYVSSIGSIIAKNLRALYNADVTYGMFDVRNTSSEGEFCDFEPTFGFREVDGAAPMLDRQEVFHSVTTAFSIMQDFCRYIPITNSLPFTKADALLAYKRDFMPSLLREFNLRPSGDKNQLARAVLNELGK